MVELNLGVLTTEMQNEKTMRLDEMSPIDIITVMNEEDNKVVAAVRRVLPQIAEAIRYTSESLKSGGRIVYIGAGTSGRLGILDAVECPPTFGVDDNTIVGLIAGGDRAFLKAVEGAEDSEEQALLDAKGIDLKPVDTVVGLTASGRTPYTIGALKYAKELGCATVAISCNENAAASPYADVAIELLPGPEILAGSTRLKAGTAEKMVLNMISTVSMIEIGKVYGNLMVDVRPTNQKLECRAESILMKATNCSQEQARKALQEAGGETKLAITRMLLGTDLETARSRLTSAGGRVKDALDNR